MADQEQQRKYNVIKETKLPSGESLALLGPDGIITRHTVAIVSHSGRKVSLSHINEGDSEDVMLKVYMKRAAFNGANAYQN